MSKQVEKKAGREAVIIAEYRLLNALAKNSGFLTDSRVHDGLFVHETAKSVYEAIERLNREQLPINKASLFQAANEIDYNVNAAVIESILASEDEAPSKIDDILSTLENAVAKSQLADIAQQLLTLSVQDGAIDHEAYVDKLIKADEVLRLRGGRSLLKTFGMWANDYIEDLKLRAQGRRYSYGDELLDMHIIKGAYPGAITTVAAATGQGKSTAVLCWMMQCMRQNIPCIYISLEMDGIDTFDRVVTSEHEMPLSALYAADHTILPIIDMVKEDIKEYENNKLFYFVEEPNLTLAKIRSIIKEFQQKTGHKYCIVAIDLITQVQDFMDNKGQSSVANSMERAMNKQNALAKELGVHFMNVVQFKRDSDSMKLREIADIDLLRPGLGDIKNSGAIAERSRVVISLFRKRYYVDRYLKDAEGADDVEDILECTILKNSSGPGGDRFSYMFVGEFFKLMPILQVDEAARLAEQAASIDF
jgi:replicative DNA helicase